MNLASFLPFLNELLEAVLGEHVMMIKIISRPTCRVRGSLITQPFIEYLSSNPFFKNICLLVPHFLFF